MRRVARLGLAAAMVAAPAVSAQPTGAQTGFATIAPQQSQAEQLRHWRILAERGNAGALFELGNAYRLGRGVPQDLDAAEAFYARAARNNHVEAQGLHGLMLIQRGAQEDGLAEVERAARRGDARARYVLGTALFYGDGLTRDRPRALELMAQAAAGGFAPARDQLAEMQQEMAAAGPPLPPPPASPDGTVALAEAAPAPPSAPRAAISPPVVPPPPVEAATAPVAAAPLPAPRRAAETQQAEIAIEPPAAEPPAQALGTASPSAPTDISPAPAPVETAPPADESAPTPAEVDAALAPPPPAAPVAIASAAAPPSPANPPPAPLPAAVEAAPVEAPPPALARAPAEPSPTLAAAAPAQAPAATAQPTPAAGGWRLQLGAFRVEGNARRAWQELGPLLPGLRPHFAQQGELTLLQAGPLADRAAARRACAVVRGAGLPCLPWGPPSP